MGVDGDIGDIEEYLRLFDGVADDLYAARRRFLRENFDGYVEDTYYYLPDAAYYCWPAQTDGRFEGFTDLLPAEEDALTPLLEAGFERLGVGVSRVAHEFPAGTDGDLVVKFGRCGMGEKFGTGRVNNLIESRISDAPDDLPVLRSLHCEPRGKFAVYPYAEPASDGGIDGDERAALEAAIRDRLPRLAAAEYAKPSNLCRWNGRLCTLDFCEFDDVTYPLGVPDHVDPETVIDGVDRLRRRGDKEDIVEAGTVTSPLIAGGVDGRLAEDTPHD